jgi:hypothetical protein
MGRRRVKELDDIPYDEFDAKVFEALLQPTNPQTPPVETADVAPAPFRLVGQPDVQPVKQSDPRRPIGSQSLALGRLVQAEALRPLQDRIIDIAGNFGYVATGRFVTPAVSHVTQGKMWELAQQRPGRIRFTDPDVLLADLQNDGIGLDTISVTGKIALDNIRKQGGRGQRLNVELREKRVVQAVQTERDLAMKTIDPDGDYDTLANRPDVAVVVPLLNLRSENPERSMKDAIQPLLAAALPLPAELELGRLDTFQSASEQIGT